MSSVTTGRLICRTILLILAITMGGTLARAQEAVTVRAWQHSDFARLVFDWPAPIGYQTNTLVYNAGGYRFSDFFRFGAPLNLVAGAIAIFGIPVIWPLY